MRFCSAVAATISADMVSKCGYAGRGDELPEARLCAQAVGGEVAALP